MQQWIFILIYVRCAKNNIFSFNDQTIISNFCLPAGNSFNADKSSQVFIEGMNELVKLLQTNEEWSNVDCLGISRYDILSADHMGANSEKKKCHFTFGTGVAVKNTEIINSMFAAQPVGMRKN